MDLLGVPSFVSLIVYFVLLAVKLYAFVNSLLWTPEHYRAADKWNKQGWSITLGFAAALQVLQWFVYIPGLVNLALTIVAFVYLADVRPALASLRRR
ncbi:DUF2516 family protein [Nocardioides sp. Kera G14]|uniref:DUF2516 family protein n=1 Tax=Nocardioides sp. Kera G14 TaxID=2884264 RepID=UPI001D109B7A|nr:DUF2516 family protein [Nocardioides sp. Kera G14]UDY23093.1 DUF2516 family protein [Nocardioides sp. Kera G14]